jgi:hypothetical protein
MQHSGLIGGSTAERRINCKGSYWAELDAPASEISPQAEVGTRIHEALESYYKNHGKGLEVLEGEEREWADAAINMANAVAERYDLPRLWSETKVPLTKRGGYGTVDLFGTAGDTLVVIDFKFGFHPVAAERNVQLLTYARGLSLLGDMPSKVVLAILQPTLRGHPDVWETDSWYIETMGELLDETVDAILDTKSPLPRTPGSWCHYCKGAATCQALRGSITAHRPQMPTNPVGLADLIRVAERAEILAEEARRYVLQQALAGAPVAGRKLVMKEGRRKWKDEKATAEAHAWVQELVPKLLSPAQVEKRVGREVYEAAFADLAEIPERGLILVPESDPREPVNVNKDDSAADMLSDF